MPAFLEKIRSGVYILRVGRRTMAFGDPYTSAGTVVASFFGNLLRVIGKGYCDVRGFVRHSNDDYPAVLIFRDTAKALKEIGFKHFTWDRLRKNGKHHVNMDTD